MVKQAAYLTICGDLIARQDTEDNLSLTVKEQKALGKFLGEILVGINQRKKGYVYTHDRIQSETAAWFGYWGYTVNWEVPFSLGNFNAEKVRFDLVAEKKKDLCIIEVKDLMNKQDFGQLNYYSDMIQKSKIKAKLFLALDFLQLDEAMNDETAMGELVKETMEREGVGMIFVDKNIIIICDTYEQLMLLEMPEIRVYNEE
ncbi:MAG: hypothetical protein V1824_01710 [archaeon]